MSTSSFARFSLRLIRLWRMREREGVEETRSVYMKMTPGLPLVSVKSIENVIQNDKELSGMGLRTEEMLDLSFLQRLEEERKGKGR